MAINVWRASPDNRLQADNLHIWAISQKAATIAIHFFDLPTIIEDKTIPKKLMVRIPSRFPARY